MAAVALLLALALVIAPGPSLHRVHTRRHTRGRRALMPLILVAAAVGAGVLAAPGVGAATVIVGVTLHVRRRRRQHRRDRTAEADALQGALDVLVGELRVGAHPVAAFGAAAGEVDGAVGASLRTVAARARMGADVAAGMRSIAASSTRPEHWERLAVCWHLAQAHGLAIATLMQTAQRDIAERERFSARVDAGMAGARTTAAVLAGLPVVGIGLGQAIGADPVGFLLAGGVGGVLLVVGVLLACAGLLWSDRITAGALK
ncbi:type II secretion system F family protein [Mycolicibacterium sp. XJ1819]